MRIILLPLFVAATFAAQTDLSNPQGLIDTYNSQQRQRLSNYPHLDLIDDDDEDAVVVLGDFGDSDVAALTTAPETNVVAYIDADQVKDKNYEPIANPPPVVTFTTDFDADEVSVPATLQARLVDKPPGEHPDIRKGKAYVLAIPISYPKSPRQPFICRADVSFLPNIEDVPTRLVGPYLIVDWVYPESAVPEATVVELNDAFFEQDPYLGFQITHRICHRPKKVQFVQNFEKYKPCEQLEIAQVKAEDSHFSSAMPGNEIRRDKVALTDGGDGPTGFYTPPQGSTLVKVVCTTDVVENKKKHAYIRWQA